MAAEVTAAAGASVTLYDAMPSVGRKFLVAGRSGLNLTHEEDWEHFLNRYGGSNLPTAQWREILSQFDNQRLRQWASELGIETFVASSGKVFPKPVDGMIKAAPLLRRWVERLRDLKVEFRLRHRWTAIDEDRNLSFKHDGEAITDQHDAIVLALGGASWPRTGSTGGWTKILEASGIKITPLEPANCGWEVEWPDALLNEAEGLPLKNLSVTAGELSRKGELVITRYGLEGAPLYHLGPHIRNMAVPEIQIDFKPSHSAEELVNRLGQVRRNFVREAKRRWKLDPATASLLKHLPDRGPWTTSEQISQEVKHCRIPLIRPRPIEEAISTGGGVSWDELDQNLMLRKYPGVFVAGEMIDWEAPTGGYLLQGCFATGFHVGNAILKMHAS